MKNSSSSAAGGVGVTGLLQVALVVLKLCGVIKWSWWWVLSPTWMSAIFVVLFLSAVFLWIWLIE